MEGLLLHPLIPNILTNSNASHVLQPGFLSAVMNSTQRIASGCTGYS